MLEKQGEFSLKESLAEEWSLPFRAMASSRGEFQIEGLVKAQAEGIQETLWIQGRGNGSFLEARQDPTAQENSSTLCYFSGLLLNGKHMWPSII